MVSICNAVEPVNVVSFCVDFFPENVSRLNLRVSGI